MTFFTIIYPTDLKFIHLKVTAVIRDERSGLGYGLGVRSMESVDNQKLESKSKMVKHYQQVVEREAKKKKFT